jgi:predicted GIY-YIG superfamily endonuclease
MSGVFIYILGSHTGTLCFGVAGNLDLRWSKSSERHG